MTQLFLKAHTSYLDDNNSEVKVECRTLLSDPNGGKFIAFSGYPVTPNPDDFPAVYYLFTENGKGISGVTTESGFVRSPDLLFDSVNDLTR